MEPSESLLVFCHHYRLPPQIAHHPPVLEALSKHVPNSHWHDRVAVLDHAQKHEEQQAEWNEWGDDRWEWSDGCLRVGLKGFERASTSR